MAPVNILLESLSGWRWGTEFWGWYPTFPSFQFSEFHSTLCHWCTCLNHLTISSSYKLCCLQYNKVYWSSDITNAGIVTNHPSWQFSIQWPCQFHAMMQWYQHWIFHKWLAGHWQWCDALLLWPVCPPQSSNVLVKTWSLILNWYTFCHRNRQAEQKHQCHTAVAYNMHWLV